MKCKGLENIVTFYFNPLEYLKCVPRVTFLVPGTRQKYIKHNNFVFHKLFKNDCNEDCGEVGVLFGMLFTLQ